MNTLDIICLVVIAVSVIICLLKGFKNIFFKLCSFVIAMYVAKIFGARVGNALLMHFTNTDKETIGASFVEKLSESMVSAIGTGLLFFVIYILLRLIFKITFIGIGKDVGSVVADRLLGGLIGLFVGVAIVFIFTELTDFIVSTVAYFKQDNAVYDIINSSKIFKFFGNLNLDIGSFVSC